MLTLGAPVRVYLAPGVTDMRKSFDGLIALTQRVLRMDPLSGHLFAFCNRRRTLMKLLVWDGSGFLLLAKRLERGTFAWPEADPGQDRITLTVEELNWILGGLDLDRVTPRSWWRRAPTACR